MRFTLVFFLATAALGQQTVQCSLSSTQALTVSSFTCAPSPVNAFTASFSVVVPNTDGPAEMPRVYLNTSLANTPAPGAKTTVTSNLQAALNAANCGDTLLLQGSFSGTFTVPAKPCDDQHWIIVTSAGTSFVEGVRMTPCSGGVSSLPGRPSFPCANPAKVLATIIEPKGGIPGPLLFANGANHYRFIGLEISRNGGTGIIYSMISTVSTTAVADKIIFDRVWLHGTAQDETKNGWLLDGFTNASLIDSWAGDLHCISSVGACTDSKVIGGGTSTVAGGPYKITGNFLEAAGENIIFGGAGASTIPADIEIRHNHFFKPMTWRKGQPGFVGGANGNPFIVKNFFELKNAQRVLVEGNIFENNWDGFSQFGYGVQLSPKNQSGWCPICAVTDVTFRYNTINNSGSGISLNEFADVAGQYGAASGRFSIHDVTINVNGALGNGVLFQIDSTWPTTALNAIAINHITGFAPVKILSLSNLTTNPPMAGFTFENSILGPVPYPVWSATGVSADCSVSDVPLTSLTKCFPQGYNFDHNAIIGVNQQSYPPKAWPAGNWFPATVAAVNFAGGDYSLAPSSPYKNAGSDGKDVGADTAAIAAATANAD